MANTDVTRIAGNIGALNALNQLSTINSQLATYQARLASGKRITSAADDPSGMSIATAFDVHSQGMQTALSAIGDAKNLMSTMEGGLTKVQSILVKMRNKALEAQGSTIGADEKQAINGQLKAFRDEINNIVQQTQWNGTALLSGSGGAGATDGLSFLTNDDVTSGSTTTNFSFTGVGNATSTGSVINASQGFLASGATGITSGSVTASGLGLDDTLIDNISATSGSTGANAVVTSVDNALKAVKAGISQVGSFTARLTFKEDALTVQYTNTQAAYNRIMNANMAEEQVNASKYAILQQTATAMLAQANQAPQFLLSLFR